MIPLSITSILWDIRNEPPYFSWVLNENDRTPWRDELGIYCRLLPPDQ